MNQFNRYMNEQLAPAVPALEAVFRMAEYTPDSRAVPGKVKYGAISDDVIRRHVPPEWTYHQFREWLADTVNDRYRVSTTWAMAGLVGEGPKVYCPTARECEALANTAVTLKPTDYRQPFDTFVVVIPDDYTFPGFGASAMVRRPCAILSRFEQKAGVWVLLVLGRVEAGGDRKELAKIKIMDETEQDIEDEIAGDSLQDGDTEILAAARRILANAAMLLVQTGARRVGRTNAEHAAKLAAKLAKKGLPDAARRQNERALRLMPVVYGFEQTIRIYDEELPPERQDGQGGYEVKPHWRRGYWQRQVCGPKAERTHVLQFRKPLLVNAHLLAGPLRNTHVTMTRRGA